MLLIRKDPPSQDVSREIKRVKHDVDWDHADLTDKEFARNSFDLLNKSIIREQLLKEQKGLCAYCMKKIRNNEKTVIEHWCPIDADPSQALSYQNMLACCKGGQDKYNNPHILCCDASKGEQIITISPLDEAHMNRVRYRTDGKIVIFPENTTLTHDINDILKLNGEVDSTGKIIHDTSTNLVHGRRQIFENYSVFINGLVKKRKPVAPAVRKKINEISSAQYYTEYAGVWLYFLSRKLRKNS